MPGPSVMPYLSFYNNFMLFNNKMPAPYRYKYVPDKDHSAMVNLTGLLLPGYFGYKTGQFYQHKPYNLPH